MPKRRNKAGTRAYEKRLFILCEGAKDHSESAYLKAFIKDCRIEGQRVSVQVIDTIKNSGKELGKEAKKLKEFDDDILWIVYDKDGYPKHPETFNLAKSNNINIAFSSISFEYWILLHFEYTSAPFYKSDDIISRLKHKHNFIYDKGDAAVYSKTKDELKEARTRAEQIQKYQKDTNPLNHPIYEFNPYTDIDKLLKAIKALEPH